MSASFRRRRRPAGAAVEKGASSSESSMPASAAASTGGTLVRLPGTKNWTGGLTLVSTGLREIDAILGGGQPLGTAILVEEDRLTFDLGMCLARYWGAEAVAQGQTLLLPATRAEDCGTTHIDDIMDDDLDAEHNFLEEDITTCSGSSPSQLNNYVNILPRDLHLDKYRSRRADLDKEKQGASVAAFASADGENNKEPRATAAAQKRMTFASIQEGDEEEEDDDFGEINESGNGEDDDGLQIAWQYRESVQRERLGHSSSSTKVTKEDESAKITCSSSLSGDDHLRMRDVYCHSYDLAGNMKSQHDLDDAKFGEKIDIVDCACRRCEPKGQCRETQQCGFDLFRSLLKRVQHHLSYPGGTGDTSGGGEGGNVVRLLLLDAPPTVTSIALPLLLSYGRTHSLALAVMIIVRPWNCHSNSRSSSSSLVSLRRSCDAVFSLDGFASFRDPPPPEFRELAGIMTLRKVASMGAGHFANVTAGRRPPSDRYGMKRDRRKVHVRLLHLPPEEESAGGSSTSGVRSGGGRPKEGAGGGCGSGVDGGSKLDF